MSDKINLQDMDISITKEDIENINIETLRDMFMKSVFVLEAALFSQAGKESIRIERLRELIVKVEDNIFDEVTLQSLSPQERINLYTTMSRNQMNSLGFLNKLQANISSGMETIASLEDRTTSQVSKNRKMLGEDESAQKNDVMMLIRSKIAEKISGGNK